MKKRFIRLMEREARPVGRAFFIVLLSLLCICGYPGTGQAGQEDVPHQIHLNGMRGPRLGNACHGCHTSAFPSVTDIDYNLCIPCHSPDGAYDGVNSPDIGARNNWVSGGTESAVYDDYGFLRSGKERWCVSCHDDGQCTINSVKPPNIAGRSISGGRVESVSLLASDIAGAENLLDRNLASGNTSAGGSSLVFDLGDFIDISHLRLYTNNNADTRWEVYGSDDLVHWTRIVLGQSVLFSSPTWQTGPQNGWNETRLDKCIPVRYIRLAKVNPWLITANALCEFEVRCDLQYGYYVNGHKIKCLRCHTATGNHIDGLAQTYRVGLNNYQAGYRLSDVEVDGEVVLPLEIPRVGCNWGEFPRTSHDFALCLACHDASKLLGDAYGTGDFFQDPLQTNFRHDGHPDVNGKITNEHLRHLRGRYYCGNGQDWDSDWDGAADSPISCPACHNVHGSPSPAMVRHGELAGSTGTSDKSPMLNLQYISQDGRLDPDLAEVMESIGGQTQFFGAGSGTVSKNQVCFMCHPDQMTYYRIPVSTCKDCHAEMVSLHPSHSTHLQSDRGPDLGCWDCHGGSADNLHTGRFADGKSLAETKVCDTCHSPAGSYDGANDPVIGAKANWREGVYQAKRLKSGREKWCAACHDEEPANSRADGTGVPAPMVIGQEKAIKPYGYYITGHGRNGRVICTDCHDPDTAHLDHEHRTYVASLGNYQQGYRLKMIDGQFSLKIRNTPPLIPDPTIAWKDFVLCLSCHNKYELLGHSNGTGLWHKEPPFGTNFGTYRNDHHFHLGLNVRNYCDSDFDGQGDSAATCTTCHNVHGSPSAAMIRHGELISPPGTQVFVPSFDFAWLTRDEGGSCIWRPYIQTEGLYEVYLRWGRGVGGNEKLSSLQARYTIAHADGETVTYQNQRENRGQWNLAGTFYFNEGISGCVALTSDGIMDMATRNNTPRDATSYIIADAVKFKAVQGLQEIVLNDSRADYLGVWRTRRDSSCLGLDYHYYRKCKRSEGATLSQSIGGHMRKSDSIRTNHSCLGCHGELFYAHPSISPKISSSPAISSAKAEPQLILAVSSPAPVFISAYVFDIDDDLSSVSVDLSPVLGNPHQPLYDDGTHGDTMAGDHVYSVIVIVPSEASCGVYSLIFTAVDHTGKQDQAHISPFEIR
ncbi:MAG: choice-of-anchor X domain-containing protein [bacterium]